jgi:hypothetical protein
LPWASIILGWGYLVNDEKISSIGSYIRGSLSKRLAGLVPGTTQADLFGWEEIHRKDPHRLRRKFEQLIVDELIFVVSGYGALIAFFYLVPNAILIAKIAAVIEVIFLGILALEIIIYADLRKGR